MIIRLTVKDNDFTSQIETYVKNFSCYIRELMPEFDIGENPVFEKLVALRQKEKEIIRIFNPNVETVLTDKDKVFIKEQIENTFGIFCDNKFEKETSEYLKGQLDIQILDSMKDKWENGEVFYWFQHADKYIVL